MRVTIICRSFYPANTPRANRVYELALELARQGHDITVAAVLGTFDYTQFVRKYKIKVTPLGKMRFSIINSDTKAPSLPFLTKVGITLFKRTLTFPDIELTWKTYKYLKKKSDFDLLITVGHPHTIHWGAAFAWTKKMKSKVWVADCGDPFMGNPHIKAPFYFKYFERYFCKKVDFITIPIEGAREAYYKDFHDKIKIIPQGLNIEKYTEGLEYKKNEVPTFIYAGSFYNELRDPKHFFEYLEHLKTPFRFVIYTNNSSLIKPYIENLKEKVEVRSYISRTEIIKEFAHADFLINFGNQSSVQLPSKLIDYSLSERPVLNISNDDDVSKIEQFLKGNYSAQMILPKISTFDIKRVAKQFLELFYENN